jgi:hypothetical protein
MAKKTFSEDKEGEWVRNEDGRITKTVDGKVYARFNAIFLVSELEELERIAKRKERSMGRCLRAALVEWCEAHKKDVAEF